MFPSAGIEHAKGFVAVVSSDANNAFAIMTARVLNPKLNIDSQSIRKLKIAGANKVIAPYVLGGARIAQSVSHPHASDFIDIVENAELKHIEMADVPVKSTSRCQGLKVGDPLFNELDIIVIGLRKPNGDFVFHPKSNQAIEIEDHLILMGPTASIDSLQ